MLDPGSFHPTFVFGDTHDKNAIQQILMLVVTADILPRLMKLRSVAVELIV